MSEMEERADMASFVDQLFMLHLVVEQCFYSVPKELCHEEIKKYLFTMEHKIDKASVEFARKYNEKYSVKRYHVDEGDDDE